MTSTKLTPLQLNRATLARQMLLRREKAAGAEAVTRLGGLQAQLARPPHIALWSRLDGYRREDLIEPATRRELVRATTMRGTLHLLGAKEYSMFRPVFQPLLTKALRSVLRERADALDVEGLLAATRAYLENGPRTFEEIRDHLESLKLPGDVRAKGFAVRMTLPLVQVPDGSVWGYPGNCPFALADTWIGDRAAGGESATPEQREDALVRWYLAAFGPATVADAQSWSGVTPLKGAFERLRPQLVVFEGEKGRELFDLPDAPRPDPETEAPVRFLPEFDSLLLAHDNRSRFVEDEHRRLLTRPNLYNLPAFLVDGRAVGMWSIEAKKKAAVLELQPFDRLSKKAIRELTAEGERLLSFVEPGAKAYEVRVVTKAKGA